MSDSTFLTRVCIKNYNSIDSCNVLLHPLVFLVGPNGAGKSNFLDALRFVADSLNTSLEHAIRQRNGIKEVRRRSGGHPNHFSIRLDFQLPTGETGWYSFRIGSRPQGGFEVQNEECRVHSNDAHAEDTYFQVTNARVLSNEQVTPVALFDRLYLVAASSLPAFRPVYEALSRMTFYNLNPDRIRDLQQPDAGDRLTRDGDNIASVIDRMSHHSREAKRRIEEYLSAVVPGVDGVEAKEIGPKETLEFRQQVAGAEHPWRFSAPSMSDGTLRALGVLVALFQTAPAGVADVPLIGIEEPEVALHPAAAGTLLDSLEEASANKQILITSHSADLLDNQRVNAVSLLAVVADRGITRIAAIDEVGRSALRDHLYTAGELLRLGYLKPDRTDEATTSLLQTTVLDESAA